MKSWYNFYRDRVNDDSYYNYFCSKYKDFLEIILDKIIWLKYPRTLNHNTFPVTNSYSEIGCGTANTTRFLIDSKHSYHYCADSNQKMLSLARKNIARTSNNKKVSFEVINAVNPQFFLKPHGKTAICHSHGLLEHFNNKDIVKIIRNQLNTSNISINYVPSNKYKHPSFGNERLMSPFRWKQILGNFDVKIHEFNNGKDLVLIIE